MVLRLRLAVASHSCFTQFWRMTSLSQPRCSPPGHPLCPVTGLTERGNPGATEQRQSHCCARAAQYARRTVCPCPISDPPSAQAGNAVVVCASADDEAFSMPAYQPGRTTHHLFTPRASTTRPYIARRPLAALSLASCTHSTCPPSILRSDSR